MEQCCHTDQTSTVLEKEVYEREISLCQKLCHENHGSCAWGECKHCGVIPLLYKLHKGTLLEDPKTIEKIRNAELG